MKGIFHDPARAHFVLKYKLFQEKNFVIFWTILWTISLYQQQDLKVEKLVKPNIKLFP